MKKLTINNFKSCKNTVVNFGKLTVNLGMNSVGKSTVTQAVLLIKELFKQMNQNKLDRYEISLNGPFDLHLGDYRNLTSSSIEFKIDKITIPFSDCKNTYKALYKMGKEYNSLKRKDLYKKDLFYLNAERLGPRNYLEIDTNKNELCGYHGEYTFHILNEIDGIRKNVESEKVFDRTDKSILTRTQINNWIKYIVPDIEVFPKIEDAAMVTTAKYRQSNVGKMVESTPFNFGFGITYMLPIIVTCLIAEKGSMVIVENPEAHLHPKGQSNMGYFLAQMAHAGVNILCETHSEHIINGIRRYALKNDMQPNDICLNYFMIEDEQSVAKRVKLNENMEILDWPEGFYDQEEEDLREIIQIRKAK